MAYTGSFGRLIERRLKERRQVLLHWCQLMTFCIFVAWGWKLLFFGAFLDELFGENEFSDALSKFFGFILILSSFGSFGIKKPNWFADWLLAIGVFILFLIMVAHFKAWNYNIGMPFRFGVQFAIPFALWSMINGRLIFKEQWLKVLLAVTFLGHSLYAIGIYEIETSYINMVTFAFNLEGDDTAVSVVVLMGALNIIMGLLLFVPQISKIALYYFLIWGVFVAVMRFVSFFDSHNFLLSLHEYLYKTIGRLPQGGIAWLILLLEDQKNDRKRKPKPI